MEHTSGRPTSTTPAAHEWVDHTSEVTLRIRAPDFEALLDEATAAFAALVPEGLRTSGGEQARELSLRAPDRVAALVDWLNEVVYLCDTCQWLPTAVELSEPNEGELRILARGRRLKAPFVLVKAATLHDAFVRARGDGLEAEVTLDV